MQDIPASEFCQLYLKTVFRQVVLASSSSIHLHHHHHHHHHPHHHLHQHHHDRETMRRVKLVMRAEAELSLTFQGSTHLQVKYLDATWVWKIPKMLCLWNISRWNFETSSHTFERWNYIICILKTLVTFSGATFPCEISSKGHFRSPRLNSENTFQDPKSPHFWHPIFPLLQKTNFILAKMKTVFSPKNSSSSSVFPLPWFFPYRVFFPLPGFFSCSVVFSIADYIVLWIKIIIIVLSSRGQRASLAFNYFRILFSCPRMRSHVNSNSIREGFSQFRDFPPPPLTCQ